MEWSNKYPYSAGEDKPNAVIFDIDQVLADIDHRLRFITEQNPRDWDKFYSKCPDDKPIVKTAKLAKIMFEYGYKILFVTGRRESIREETVGWLSSVLDIQHEQIRCNLFMRPDGDKRADYVVKKELFDNFIKGYFRILFVIEDRKSCVGMWRKEGLLCLQNEWGDF